MNTALACVGRSLGKTKEPLRVAEEFSVIDQISGGRLIAGFPISLSYDSNQNQGIPPIETRPRFAENLALIDRALVEEKPFAFNGQFNKHPYVNLWPRPVQRKLPIWAPAVGNPVTLKGILERDQVFLYPGWFGPRQAGSAVFKRYWDMAARDGARRQPVPAGLPADGGRGRDRREAHREYGPHIENGFRNAFGAMPMSSLGLAGYHDIKGVEAIARNPADFGLVPKMKTITYKELVDAQCAIVGSAETVAEQLIELVKDFRIGSLLLMTQMGSMPTELAKKNISLIAERVIPKLRKAWTDNGFEQAGLEAPMVAHRSVLMGASGNSKRKESGAADMNANVAIKGPQRDELVEAWDGQVKVRVRVAGTGPALVYLHPAAGLYWDRFLDGLAEHYTVYAPEMPGTTPGRSVRDLQGRHVHRPAADLRGGAAQARAQGRGRGGPVDGGHGRVRSGGVLPRPVQQAGGAGAVRPVARRRAQRHRRSVRGTAPGAAGQVLFHNPATAPGAMEMMTPPPIPEAMPAFIAQITWMQGVAGKFLWPFPEHGLRSRLHRIQIPTLLLWGANDRVTPAKHAEDFHAGIRNSQLHVYDNCGHILQMERLHDALRDVNASSWPEQARNSTLPNRRSE